MFTIHYNLGFFGKLKQSMSITKKSGKDEEEGEVELRATGRGGKGNRLTQLYIGAVDRSKSGSRASEPSLKPKRSFNRSAFKVDKDEIKKAYHDVRSDKTGIHTIVSHIVNTIALFYLITLFVV